MICLQILYAGSLNTPQKNLLEWIKKFSQVAGYKINIEQSVVFLYTNNKLFEKKIKKTILFTIATKRIKYLGINLIKKVKNFYTENYETLVNVFYIHYTITWILSIIIFSFLKFYFIYFFIEQVIISHPFYTHQCIHVNPNLPIHHTTTPTPCRFPPWCRYICSVHLCLNFCPANRFICTIFLGSTYMR